MRQRGFYRSEYQSLFITLTPWMNHGDAVLRAYFKRGKSLPVLAA
jgi:hypothetical protein